MKFRECLNDRRVEFHYQEEFSMIKETLKFSTLCLVGSLIFASNVVNVNAEKFSQDKILGEYSVAGIALSLDEYYNFTTQANTIDSTTVKTKALSLTDSLTGESSDKGLDEKKKVESIKSKYENVGIAVVDNHLNIREKPGEDEEIIGKLPKNAGCTIYSINKDGWAKIKSGKVTGYVMSTFLVSGDEAEELAQKVGSEVATVKNTATLRVREEKNTDSTTLTLVPEGEELEVKKVYDEWVKVSIDQDVGYVSKDFVTITYELDKAVSVEEVQEDSSTGVTSVRASMVAYAKQFLGNPYVWGGTSLTHGTDCSGFVMSIYSHFGYSISRTSRAQSANGTSINASSVRPGDLVFYGSGGGINHVAMYIGGGQVIHASNPRTGIKISAMYYRTPLKAVRIIND
jgi:cell wall-associated NlpC family hydrolase